MRLLLVEDHPDLAKWLVGWLTQGGFVVEHLDLSLPGLDGLDVLRRLRDRGDASRCWCSRHGARRTTGCAD